MKREYDVKISLIQYHSFLIHSLSRDERFIIQYMYDR